MSWMDDEGLVKAFFYSFLGLGLLFCLVFAGCNDPDSATRILRNDGYENIVICGTNWVSCGEGDWFRTCFKAKKNGNEITGTVCSGLLFKGHTVRVD